MKISGHFGQDTNRVAEELQSEIDQDGVEALLDHLRLCGSIPESYGHDSSEEKLYSKYTDTLFSAALRHIGLRSIVLTERADAADVEAVEVEVEAEGGGISLVGDAKVFRLSRTAKNQKDFKVEAMHSWKRGKPHAMILCPIYQLPTRSSQIYLQASVKQVCIYTYAHLSVLVRFADEAGGDPARRLLLKVLNGAESMNPTKDAIAYWATLNRTMIGHDKAIRDLWRQEKEATVEAVSAAKEEALTMLAQEREHIMRMTREQAITHLIKNRNLHGRERVIRAVADNGIFAIL